MDKPDPYVELCQMMQDLETRGVPSADMGNGNTATRS
jgi:hypothetical protein